MLRCACSFRLRRVAHPALDADMQISVRVPAFGSSEDVLRIGIAASFGSFMSHVLRTLGTVVHGGCPVGTPTSGAQWAQFLHVLASAGDSLGV